MAGKFLINCFHGKNNTEYITIAFLAAAGATGLSEEVVIFLASDAVRLTTPGYANYAQAPKFIRLQWAIQVIGHSTIVARLRGLQLEASGAGLNHIARRLNCILKL